MSRRQRRCDQGPYASMCKESREWSHCNDNIGREHEEDSKAMCQQAFVEEDLLGRKHGNRNGGGMPEWGIIGKKS